MVVAERADCLVGQLALYWLTFMEVVDVSIAGLKLEMGGPNQPGGKPAEMSGQPGIR